MQQKGFAMPLVLVMIGLIIISVIFSIRNTIQTSNTNKTDDTRAYPSTNTQVDTSVVTKTPVPKNTPIPTTFSGNSFNLKAKSDVGTYVYTFTFNKQNSDSIDIAVTPYDPSPQSIGIIIKRADVTLSIKVGFEGFGSVYEAIPEHVVVNNPNFTKDTITRIKKADKNTYVYTNHFEIGPKDCSQWRPEPVACGSESISTGHEVFYISCDAATEVSTCDDIFKSLSYSRVLLK
ncbi:hypothetical protein KBD68_01530 [Candidatus Woesebacteria bacterium]|nr:hypothetical protein [Candidatus Woesebacteria bacterium]